MLNTRSTRVSILWCMIIIIVITTRLMSHLHLISIKFNMRLQTSRSKPTLALQETQTDFVGIFGEDALILELAATIHTNARMKLAGKHYR